MNIPIKNDTLFIDFLNAGPMIAGNLTAEITLESGKRMAESGLRAARDNEYVRVKNHCVGRAHLSVGEGENEQVVQVQFGMDVAASDSVRSTDAQYGSGGCGGGSDSSCGAARRTDGIPGEPEPPTSPTGVPLVLSPFPGSDKGIVENDVRVALYSDAGSGQGTAPKIASDSGGDVGEPIEGAPVPGNLNFHVQNRTIPSWKALAVFEFVLRPGTTIGQLTESLTSRCFGPFMFRKLNFAYFGCRDFVCVRSIPFLSTNCR